MKCPQLLLFMLVTLSGLGLAGPQPCLAGDAPPIRRADTLPATTPWNLDELSKPPGFEWRDGKEIRSLFYKGEPHQGKPTRVFAYYATPGSLAGDPSLDKAFPGIILVHDGGGYAAIAMDLGIRGPADEKFLADGGPPQKDSVKFATGQPVADQWTYHAVADVIRAHFTVEPLQGASRTRKWTSQPATLSEDSIMADLPPAEATVWFLTLTDPSSATPFLPHELRPNPFFTVLHRLAARSKFLAAK